MVDATRKIVAVIESGGTKCTVILAVKGRIVARATAGAGNYTSLGLQKTLERLKGAVEIAISQLPDELRPTCPGKLPLKTPLFAALTVGMAGLDRTSDVEALTPPLAELFQLESSDQLRFMIGNDATLLSIPLIADHKCQGGVAMVSGTGSVAFSYTKGASGIPVFRKRAGGYGHLLGDEGSGYHVGKMAIVSALSAFDKSQPFTPFQQAVYEHFQCLENPQLLLQRVYEDQSTIFPGSSSATRIASVCKAVLETLSLPDSKDDEADQIVLTVTESVATLVQELVDDAICPSQCTLVLGGSLYRNNFFKSKVDKSLDAIGLSFRSICVLEDAGAEAALVLSKEIL